MSSVLDLDFTIVGEGGGFDVIGTSGDDTIGGSEDAEVIYGGKGDDVIAGCGGHDKIYGGKGDDLFILEAGSTVTIKDFTDKKKFFFSESDKIAVAGVSDGDTVTVEGNEVKLNGETLAFVEGYGFDASDVEIF